MKPREWQLNEVKIEITGKEALNTEYYKKLVQAEIRKVAQYRLQPGEQLTLRVDVRYDLYP